MKSEDFLANLSRSLGREAVPTVTPDAATHLSLNAAMAQERALQVAEDMSERADELMANLERTAVEAAWRVFRTKSLKDAANYIREVARDIEARTMLRTQHAALDALNIEETMRGTGISLEVMAVDQEAPVDTKEAKRGELRRKAIVADVGITGVD
ncbi:MAG: hypothetical protein F4Y44_00690, partial [Chloroflexi bacterium]|nr:hypothetical protein [Chloroflexota bacterium]